MPYSWMFLFMADDKINYDNLTRKSLPLNIELNSWEMEGSTHSFHLTAIHDIS